MPCRALRLPTRMRFFLYGMVCFRSSTTVSFLVFYSVSISFSKTSLEQAVSPPKKKSKSSQKNKSPSSASGAVSGSGTGATIVKKLNKKQKSSSGILSSNKGNDHTAAASTTTTSKRGRSDSEAHPHKPKTSTYVQTLCRSTTVASRLPTCLLSRALLLTLFAFFFLIFRSYSLNRHRTATADGQMMAQMLSTFSKLEQSRFEAFQRSSLDAASVQDFVAACLVHRHNDGGGDHLRRGRIVPSRPVAGAAAATTLPTSRTTVSPSLDDLVAPGQAADVALAVSTLAKVYAQRLVASALAERQRRDRLAVFDGDDNDNDRAKDPHRPLEPYELLRAHQSRVSQGLDPGFFLQAHEGVVPSRLDPLASRDAHRQQHLAALEAQDAYDAAVAAAAAAASGSAANDEDATMDDAMPPAENLSPTKGR